MHVFLQSLVYKSLLITDSESLFQTTPLGSLAQTEVTLIRQLGNEKVSEKNKVPLIEMKCLFLISDLVAEGKYQLAEVPGKYLTRYVKCFSSFGLLVSQCSRCVSPEKQGQFNWWNAVSATDTHTYKCSHSPSYNNTESNLEPQWLGNEELILKPILNSSCHAWVSLLPLQADHPLFWGY